MLLLRAIVGPDAPELRETVVVRSTLVAAYASGIAAAPAPSEAALREHHAVVERIHAARACLPARFGRVFTGEAALRDALEQRASGLAERLAQVGDRVELAVTLSWRRAAPAVSRSSGRAYLASRAAQEAERRHAEVLVASLVEDLRLERPHVRHETCPAAGIAASLAVLAGRDEVKDMATRIAAFAERSELVRGEVYGPMAPYTFAS